MGRADQPSPLMIQMATAGESLPENQVSNVVSNYYPIDSLPLSMVFFEPYMTHHATIKPVFESCVNYAFLSKRFNPSKGGDQRV